jgi:hypothetical protein
MLMRSLCVAFLICMAPVAPCAATLCCDAGDECCEGDLPTCPVLPGGTCSVASASQVSATIRPAPDQVPHFAAESFPFAARALEIGSVLATSVPDPDPPHFSLHQPLRN